MKKQTIVLFFCLAVSISNINIVYAMNGLSRFSVPQLQNKKLITYGACSVIGLGLTYWAYKHFFSSSINASKTTINTSSWTWK